MNNPPTDPETYRIRFQLEESEPVIVAKYLCIYMTFGNELIYLGKVLFTEETLND